MMMIWGSGWAWWQAGLRRVDHVAAAHVHRDVPDAVGMTVDPATASARRGTGRDRVYFCSAGCAAACDADPGRYAGTPVASGLDAATR